MLEVEPRPHEVQPVCLGHDTKPADELERVGGVAGRGQGHAERQVAIEILIGAGRPGQAHRGADAVEVVVGGG